MTIKLKAFFICFAVWFASGVVHFWFIGAFQGQTVVGGLAGTLGYTFVPVLIFYFIIKRSTSQNSLVLRSFFLVFVSSLMVWIDVDRTYQKQEVLIAKECNENNEYAADTFSVNGREAFCSCIASKTVVGMMRAAREDFIGLNGYDDPLDDPDYYSLLSNAFAQCTVTIAEN